MKLRILIQAGLNRNKSSLEGFPSPEMLSAEEGIV